MARETQDDPFESLFSLEDQYYQEGYSLGVADGSKSGRIEGRVFGLERGFEKFAAMGALAGKCAVWESRLSHGAHDGASQKTNPGADTDSASGHATEASQIPGIPDNARLAKHLQTLYALAEAESLSTQNTEEAVSDFDDRLKRAEGKVKVIAKIIGEDTNPFEDSDDSDESRTAKRSDRSRDNMEDFSIPQKRS